MGSKIQKLLVQLPYLPQTLHLVWKAARPWTLTWVLLLLIQGLLPVATVYLTRALVDSLVVGLDSEGEWADFTPALVWVLLMVGVLILSELLRSLTKWVRTAQGELVQDYVTQLIHDQSISLDMAFYEQPDYYDKLYRARFDALHKPIALLENLGSLSQHMLTLLAMAVVLIPFGWWLPPVLLISAVPAFLVILRYTIHLNNWRQRTTMDQRRTHYYNLLLTDRDMAAEIRVFALGNYLKTAYQSLRQRLRVEHLQMIWRQSLAELAAAGLGLLTLAGVMAWMAWRTVQGHFSLGDLALFYQAFNQAQKLMRTLMESANQVYANILFLQNLIDFLGLTSQLADPSNPQSMPENLQIDIQFQDVTFRYPDSDRDAIANFNLTIPAGKIVALVGVNGAGKSTLVKLLCRFYDPQAGQITIDGVDLRDVAQVDLWRQLTLLFQDPVQYQDTATQNIAYGDIETQLPQAEIEQAAKAAGADAPIDRLPQGYETVLGKVFGGAELSGGEWQRLALARAFLRKASIIILDEPTSALDSWAEADWMQRFRRLAAGRTSLIITHRFTTARQADIIHVMDAGQIIESGSHEELLALNGQYANSWRAQVEKTVSSGI
ncbi:MAG: ABC transporter ATP-binding protein [Chloroflexota bacterium]